MLISSSGLSAVQVNRERVETNNVFDGILAIVLGQLEFLVLDGPAGVGDVDRAVDQGRDTGAGAAAADGYHYSGVNILVGFRPGLGDINQRVGTLVLDDLALFTTTTGVPGPLS